MSIVPISESLTGLSAIEKANIGKYIFEEAKAGASALSRTIRNRNRRKRQRMRKAQASNRMQMALASRAPLSAMSLTAPVAYGQRIRQDYSGLDTYVVKHSEYLSDIFGSTAFAIRQFRINTADAFTFPWLSNIASNFEKYRFRKLRFTLRPQAPSITPGVVMMAFDYDPTDPAPTSKAEMLQYDGAVRVNTWGSLDMLMKPAPALLTASIPPPASADLRLTDAANLFIATQGQGTTDPISELWAEYEVELLIPQSRSSCDAFAFAVDFWTGADFDSATVVNDSVNFELVPGASEIRVIRSGLYGISAYEFGFPAIDISVNPSEQLGVLRNGVAVTSYQAAGPSSSLPSQTVATFQSVYNGISLTEGDVLSFSQSTASLTSRLRVGLYSL